MTNVDLDYLLTPRHIDEWHEDMGDVRWWSYPITEAPYVGSPLDCPQTVAAEIAPGVTITIQDAVKGWPGHHEWWTPSPTNEQIGLIQSRIEAAIKAREAQS